MAIDLFCYTTHELDETELALKEISDHNQEFFLEKFIISDVVRASDVQKDMASEYGIYARSIFLVRLNDKSAAGLMQKIVAILKERFGLHDIAVLLENERLL